MAFLLGVDLGTGGARALVVDERGRLAGDCTSEYPLSTPRPLWAEQDPADWWRGVTIAIRGALTKAGVSGADIACVGLTGQMHSLVLTDESDQVLRPAILWCDQRTQSQCDEITELVGGRDRLIELTSNPAITGFTAPKLLWIRQHEPALYARARRAFVAKDYIRYLLTGEHATEVSDASGTLLLDVTNRRWSLDMLAALEIDERLLPAVYESTEVSGRISARAAAETGLAAGTPVVGGGGDQAAGGVGNGIVREGLVSSTIGTSGVVFAATERPVLDPGGRIHTFCHAVPGMWHVMGVTLAAGMSLRWLRDELGQAERALATTTGIDPYVYLTQEAAQAPAGCDGLIYLPYLMGERTPHLDAGARGVFFGLAASHGRAMLLRSVLEGVAYSLRDCLELLRGIGIDPAEVRCSGGGGRSELWRQIQADIFGVPAVTLNVQEGPGLGAALLAGVGAGIFGSVSEACDATLAISTKCEPDPSRVRVYDGYYQVYQSLYPALKSQFERVTALSG